MASPTQSQEPGAREHSRERDRGRRNASRPTVEPRAGRVRIDPEDSQTMPPRVVDHVQQRRSHLARSTQCPGVIPIREDGSPAPPQLVQPPRHANEQPLHAARQRSPIAGLGQQVRVVRLDRVLHEPKAEPLRATRERALDHTSLCRPPQTGQASLESHRDVDRMAAGERGPRAVRNAGARSGGLSASAASGATPRAKTELVLPDSSSLASHASESSSLDDSCRRTAIAGFLGMTCEPRVACTLDLNPQRFEFGVEQLLEHRSHG